MGAFRWSFGDLLVPFELRLGVGSICRPFSTLVGLSSLPAPPVGGLWAPFRSLQAFWQHFGWILQHFPKSLSVFSLGWPLLAASPIFFNDFKRAERASERSEPRAKLFVESATRGSHCIFLPRMTRQTFQIIDVNPCSREGLLLTRFPLPC